MLHARDTDFQALILIFLKGLWKSHTHPKDWQLSLLQPMYKGHSKDKLDPPSYRGIYLNDTLTKLFKGLLINRLTIHTEPLNTISDSQLITKPDTQNHHAICCFFVIIQHNKDIRKNHAYVAFLESDFSTAYHSIHRDSLSSTLLKNDIRGNMWHHLMISGPGLKILNSEFFTMAFPIATQSTSSEYYLKEVVLVQLYSEYLSPILYTNSKPNSLTGDLYRHPKSSYVTWIHPTET